MLDTQPVRSTLITSAGCVGCGSEDMPATPSNPASEELRSVIAIIRHGDRTPKQKMKVRMQDAAMLELLRIHGDPKKGCAKLKQPAQLQAVLDVVNSLLNAGKV
jgi:inositol hexakisphosphate/diphosphoinositol-pentakisphosphate kinase